MPESYAIWAPTLLCATCRVAGLLLVAPAAGHAAVPVRLRLLAAVAVALAVVSRLAAPVALPGSWLALAGGLAGELVIGAALGYAARLLFVGVELGAAHVSAQLGLSLAEAADPAAGEPSAAVGGLFHLLALVIFLSVGGLRALLGGLMATFQAVPLLGFAPRAGMFELFVGLLAGSFVLALKLAAPVLVAMLTAAAVLGFLQRAVPQLGLLSVELPGRALLGLLTLAAGMAVLLPLMEAATDRLGLDVQSLVQMAR